MDAHERRALPEGWELVDLKEYAYFQEGPGIRKWQFRDKGIKLLNVTNIIDGKLQLDTTDRFVDEKEVAQKYKHFLLNPSEIVMASSGVTWGKIATVAIENLPLMLNTSTIRFKSLNENKLMRDYLLLFLDSRFFKNQIKRLITGSAQPNFGSSHLKQVKLILPPLPTQRRIVSILEKAEETKRLRAQANELTDRLLQSVFLEMFGNDVEILNLWEWKTIEDCMEAIIDYRGKTPPKTSTGIPLITAKIVEQGEILQPEEFISPDFYDAWMVRGIPKYGDVLFTTEGPLGEVAQLNFKEKVALAQRIILLRGKENLIDNKFLVNALVCPKVRRDIESRSSGSTVKGIRQNELRQVKIPVPPFGLQNKFARIVEKIESMRQSQNQSKQQIEDLFSALMQKAFRRER